MDDWNPPADYDPIVEGENLLRCLHWCLSTVARYSMRPEHFEEYEAIVLDFDDQRTTYNLFRFQMNELLARSEYAHLRVYWDVFHRVITEEDVTMLDDCRPLFLYPIVLYSVCILFLHVNSVRLWDPLRMMPVPLIENRLVSGMESALLRSRRYRWAEPFGDRPVHLNFYALLSGFQQRMAEALMTRVDLNRYNRLTCDLREGRIPHDEFMEEMEMLLWPRNYESLRLWWYIHRIDARRGVRMVDNPLLRPALAVLLMLYIVYILARFGDSLWNPFVVAVRGRQP